MTDRLDRALGWSRVLSAAGIAAVRATFSGLALALVVGILAYATLSVGAAIWLAALTLPLVQLGAMFETAQEKHEEIFGGEK